MTYFFRSQRLDRQYTILIEETCYYAPMSIFEKSLANQHWPRILV